jgi:hypothetical protein
MDKLPAELQMFGDFIDAQPPPVQEAFQYCLCLMMVETGGMRLLNTINGDEKVLCYFETTAGDAFTIPKPHITPEQEADIVEVLRELLSDEDLV